MVNSDETLGRCLGVSSTSLFTTGRYKIIFNRDVSVCAYVATIGLFCRPPLSPTVLRPPDGVPHEAEPLRAPLCKECAHCF